MQSLHVSALDEIDVQEYYPAFRDMVKSLLDGKPQETRQQVGSFVGVTNSRDQVPISFRVSINLAEAPS